MDPILEVGEFYYFSIWSQILAIIKICPDFLAFHEKNRLLARPNANIVKTSMLDGDKVTIFTQFKEIMLDFCFYLFHASLPL